MSKLSERLKKDSLVNQYQLEYAEQWVERSSGTLIDAIIELRLVNEPALLKHLATVEKTRYVSAEKLSKLKVPSNVLAMVAAHSARTHVLLPIMYDDASRTLTLVSQAPFSDAAVGEVAAGNPGVRLQLFVGLPSAVRAAVARNYDNDVDSFKEIESRINEDIAAFLRLYAAEDSGEPSGEQPFVVTRTGSASADIVIPQSSSALPTLPPPPSTPALPPIPTTQERTVVRPPTHERAATGPAFAAGIPAEGADALALLEVMVGLVELKRTQLKGHSADVARLSAHVAERLGLSEQETRSIATAAWLHELGKKDDVHLTLLSIHDNEELAALAREQHQIPGKLVSGVRFSEEVHTILDHLYESFDGSGIPDGLSGNAIPTGARIIALADAFEDLTDNPENFMGRALEVNAALEVLRMHGDLQFDPRIIEAVAQILLTEDLRKKLLAASPWVLITDRKLDDTSVLEFKLTQKGYNVVVCKDTEAALKRAAAQDFDLFISEVETTPLDGFAFIKEVRRDPRHAATPFVFFSKVADAMAVQRGFDLGATDYVTKPFSADVLAAKVKRYIDERPRDHGPRKDRGVAGSLSEMALPDILQVLGQGRKSGQLLIRHQGREGEIYLDQGRVVDAIAGGLRGEEAFYSMIGWDEGDFRLDPEFLMMGGTITRSTEGLIMEGLRRLDESKR
jgi:response regulator RpfG family c-di-GMP phosphodiesterase